MEHPEYQRETHGTLAARIRTELQPRRVLPSLTLSLVVAVLEVALSISFAALIFAGPAAVYLGNGIAFALLGAAVGGAAIGMLSSVPGMVGGNQDTPAAILAVMAAAVVGRAPEGTSPEALFVTVTATIALSTLTVGLVHLAIGQFQLGKLGRFLPYPVVGGFLAGTGWLLAVGAIGLMAELPVTLDGLSLLLSGTILIRWLPGLGLALAILVLSRRFDNFWLLPAILLLSTGLFYAVGALLGQTPADLSAQGWLIGPFTDGIIWRPIMPADLTQVDWASLWAQAPNAPGLVLVSLVALLLNASGVEVASGQDTDLNQELKASGVGNILAALVGGLPGYQQLSLSILSVKVGIGSRLTALFTALICLLVLLLGTSALAGFPKVVVGGLLLYLGLSFLYDWLVEPWFRFPKVDYAIIVAILAVIIAVGFLEGVLVGLVAAVIMFVVAYSRVDVVRHTLDGATYRSRVTRSASESRYLEQHGRKIFVLELQGFIFFGTAHALLEQVHRHLHRVDALVLDYVIIDFSRVTGLDSTAMRSFERMRQLAKTHQFVLTFSGASSEVRRQFHLAGFGQDQSGVFYLFADMDHAVEWSETDMLSRANKLGMGETTLLAGLKAVAPDHLDVAALMAYLEAEEVPAGHYLMRQGDPPDNLYFIANGQVSAHLELKGQPPIRLETMKSGRVVGELGFYLGNTRTADVVADEPSLVYRLTAANLRRMEAEAPEVASILHQLIIHLLSERVTHLVGTVSALQR